MTNCPHTQIVLLPPAEDRRRCRHCHLTISAEELGDGCCPECLEADGQRRYDFDTVPAAADAPQRYRCEVCGAILTPAG